MHIETLYDRGSAPHIEDFHLVSLPFLVVSDGVSPPYGSEHPLFMIEGQSAGAVAGKIVCDTFALALPNQPLTEVMVEANRQVATAHERWGRPLDRADLLAGASVVAVKLGDEIEIAHVADAIAFWRLHSGEIGATENRMYDYEANLLQIFAETMAEVGGDREAAWVRYGPIRRAIIQECANRPGPGNYSVMNGQSALVPLISTLTIPREEVAELVICSDGLVPFELTRDSAALAQWFFNAYDAGGLEEVLTRKREIESRNSKRTHVNHAEVTAIAVEF